MHRTLLWLGMAFLACSLSSLADGAQLQVLAAPNILRVRTPENIFVECQDCSDKGAFDVYIRVRSYPNRNHLLAETKVKLDSQNNYQALAAVTITDHTLVKNYPNVEEYVYVQAQFPDRLLEKVVLVSFQSGYIFIQTDKTIYTPNSKVYYRTFAVTPGMEPIEKAVTIEMQTPEGIIFQLNPKGPLKNSGIISDHYEIPAITSTGVWKVAAFFPNSEQHKFYAEFEIKEYVLPSFEVKLEPTITFFKVDSKTFEVQITAKYLYGKYVDGNAYVVFGVFDQDKKTTSDLFRSLQKIPLTEGKGTATLKMEHFNQAFPNILELAQRQSTIYALVSVLTQSGGELVEAEIRGIHIVRSPYTISLKKTPKHYKRGYALDVTVQVTNPDKTPAPRVEVMVNPGGVRATTDDAGLARVPYNIGSGDSSLQITASTMETDGSQASATITVNPYSTSSSNNDLHIGVVKEGNNIRATFNFGRLGNLANHDITYLVLSGGQILQKGRETRKVNEVMEVPLTLTKEMLPSFRLIAYYHVNATEVVSDSVLVDVKYTCMGSLKIESAAETKIYQPGKRLKLKVTGDPGAKVGLVAVDKGVYVLNNKYRLTQRKVWDIVEMQDAGCTPGGGHDSMGVFYDAGLMFVTNTAFGTNVRTDPKCPAMATRRKRATTIADARITLERQYKNELRKCCVDGMRDTPLSYDCQRRSEYIVDRDQECIDAFLHCCRNLTSQRADRNQFHLDPRNCIYYEDDGFDMVLRTTEITSRTKFDESWLFDMVEIPNCSSNGKCVYMDTKGQKMPDSITTWQLTAISLSKSHGICVSEPFEVITQNKFFIDLRLPYSAVKGEQLEIKAILHNLNDDPIEVRLELLETEHVCSMASKRKKYRVPGDVVVAANSQRAVPFVIIPMQAGQHDIEVKGMVKHVYHVFGVKKKLLVVHAGELQKIPVTISLDPSKHNGRQQVTVNNKLRRELQVPGSPTKTEISITGGSQMSSLVENALSGKSMGSLIFMPGGCGEQNLGYMAFPVIAATYLDAILKWEDVGGLSQRDAALNYIRTGYVTQLKYRDPQKCYSVWQGDPCHLKLTAYVVKVFAMASNLVTVDNNELCGAVSWLIAQQKSAGNFEDSRSFFGLNTETSVTAFTLIALKEAQTKCSSHVSMQSNIDNAVAYLERQLLGLTTTYAVAITSYALALADRNKFNKAFLLKSATGGNHWSVNGAYTHEATGYALLALVKGEAFKEAKPVVKWLNQQRTYTESYSNSQATMVAYQALAEYWTKADVNVNELDVNLDVEISQISEGGRKLTDTINFNKDNIYTTRTLKPKNALNLNVTASGPGEATLTVVSHYYALPVENKSDCQNFNLSVKLIPEKVGGGANDLNVYMLKIEVMYNSMDTDASMTIVDIRMPTGYAADIKDLENLSTGVAHSISSFEFDKALSEQGSIIIYLNKVSRERPEEIAFRIEQKFKVEILQPAAVSVYEYYNDKPCVKFYRPERPHGELIKLCRGDVCVCAEENCSKQKKDKISNDARTTMACHIEEKNRVDYVYKVRVEDVKEEPAVHTYQMLIVEVLKEGSDSGVLQQKRAFISFPHCASLDKDKTFLIMGMFEDMYFDVAKQEYQYMLGERTWIEYWPTGQECQEEEYRPICLGMEGLYNHLRIYGCET